MTVRCYDTCCQPDDNSEFDYTVIGRRQVKAVRKPQPCNYCGKTIAVGRPAHVDVVVSCGKALSIYRHHPADCEAW